MIEDTLHTHHLDKADDFLSYLDDKLESTSKNLDDHPTGRALVYLLSEKDTLLAVREKYISLKNNER